MGAPLSRYSWFMNSYTKKNIMQAVLGEESLSLCFTLATAFTAQGQEVAS